MTLTRTLSAEMLKLRRTLALKMVVLAPAAIIALTLFMASQAPFSTLRRGRSSVDAWAALSHVNLQFWGLLMLPLFVTLETALVAAIDHTDNQWKALFARAVPRWNVYLAKLTIIAAMVASGSAVLVIGILVEGTALDWYDAGLGFGSPPHVGLLIRQTAEMAILALFFLTIQHWVSLRWKSFSAAIGFGSAAICTSFAMLLAAGQYGAWPQYFPWSLPMLVIARHPQNVNMAMFIGGLAGILMTALGCADFCRREVT
jgi:hypothetical protein